MIIIIKGNQQKKCMEIIQKPVPPKDILPKCPVVTFQSSIWAKGQKAGRQIIYSFDRVKKKPDSSLSKDWKSYGDSSLPS